MPNVGDNIKAARIAQGWSESEAARAIGMDSAHYSRIERGGVDPLISTLERIAVGLDISIADLLEGVD